MRREAPEPDAAIAEIARMLGALPVVLPASGSCAPLEPSDLSFSGHEPKVAAPEIGMERLQTFPDVAPPLNLPSPPPSPSVVALLAPVAPNEAMPWSPKRAPRRWAWALDAIVVVGLLCGATLRSPLASHPVVRPYAGAATSIIE
ncbi:MAG: hypothetical protein K0S65_5021, partial [Labilithrix sp.]|nr:hypothetical protein [Labilithrix sp.]